MFYDLRGKERSDKMPDEFVQLAVSEWEQVTRPSERKKDQLKPPFQKDGPLHAVHWLEMRIAEVHAAILEKGKETFGDEFHFSYGFTFAVKPWFVKKSGAKPLPLHLPSRIRSFCRETLQLS